MEKSSSETLISDQPTAPLVNGNGTSESNGTVKVNGGSPNITAFKEKEQGAVNLIVKGENGGVKKRRKRNNSLIDDDINHQPPVGKRVRLQHQPFQSPAVKNVVPNFFRQPPSSKNGDGEEKIVVFNKGDFLAVRNELNGFYVCRTAQNVYKDSRKFKIQWLNDEKDHYKPDFFDKTDFECVLTNLRIVRLGKEKYRLPEDEQKRATNILQRALNVEKGIGDIPDPRQVVADGVDVSIIGKAEEKELVEIVSKIEKQEKSPPEKEEKKEPKSSSAKSSRRPSLDVSSKSSRASSRRGSSEIEKLVIKSDVKENEKGKTNATKYKLVESKTEKEVAVSGQGRKEKKKKMHHLKKERTLRPRGHDSSPARPSPPEPIAVKEPVPKKAAVKKVVTSPPVKSSKVTPTKPAAVKGRPKSEKAIREKRQITGKKEAIVEKKVAEKSPKKVLSPLQIKAPSSPKKDHHKPLVECDFLSDLIGVVSTNWFKDMEKSSGQSCSILTAIHGSLNQLQTLIKEGADINMKEPTTGNTALHLLCKMSKKPEKVLDTLEEILKHKPDLNSINNDGRTPLHFAANSVVNEFDLTIVETLLKHGADRRIQDKDGRIPLHYAFVKIDRDDDTTFSDPVELTIMLTNGDRESVDVKDAKGQLPLHRATQRGGTFSVTHLIRCSSKFIDERDCNSNTPLSIAIKSGYENCTFSMILKGCNFGLSMTRQNTQQQQSVNWSWIHAVNVPKVPEESSIIIEVMKRKWNRLIHLLLEMLTEVGQDLSHALIAAIKCNNLKLAYKISKRMKPSTIGPFLHSLAETFPNEENKEHLKKLFDLILEKSLSKFDTLDKNNSSSLTIAAMNHNSYFCEEITKKMDSIDSVLSKPDRFGRTPLTALFYRFTINDIDQKIQSWAGKLSSGKSALYDCPCYFPVKEAIYPCVRYVHDESLFGSKYPPLIFSVIKGNFYEVKFLMAQKVDVNVTDDQGRTAIMHAVRLNDIKMIKTLLTSRYEPDTDLNPWTSRFLTFKKSTAVDLSLIDHDGNTVVHHAVAPMANFTYSNSDVIVRLLSSAGAPLDIVNTIGKSPLRLAIERKTEKLIQTLKDLLPEDKHPAMGSNQVNGSFDKVSDREVPNYESDSAAVLESLQTEETGQLLKVSADKLLGFGDSSEVLMDEKQSVPYSVLLIKPDKDNWGLSHFLKLQIVIHKQRSIVVLFNHSGQLGQGQVGTHSKDTYSNKREAIEEFTKLFKLKTGNNWSELDKFVNQSKKYRLIPMKIKSSDVKVKLEELRRKKEDKVIDSKLPTEVSNLISSVMSELTTPSSHEDIDCVSCVKLITENTIKKAEDILFEIGVIIGEREKELKQIAKKTVPTNSSSRVLDQLVDLSDEFFNLIPIPIKYRLNPILTESDHRSKNDILRRIQNHIICGKMLIGSYNKLSLINQRDYIHDCLKCQINILDSSSIESQIILQFIHNSSLNQQKSKFSVESIYKIIKKSQEDQLMKSNLSNHWLLFHSVPPKELINILSSGLQITSSDTFMKVTFCKLF